MHRNLKAAVIIVGSTLIVARGILDFRKTRTEGRSARKLIIDEMGVDVAAIHNATDVINAQIERGEIRDYDTLRARVLDEVAFQKIVIREAE